MKWGFLDDDSGYFYCIIYTKLNPVRDSLCFGCPAWDFQYITLIVSAALRSS